MVFNDEMTCLLSRCVISSIKTSDQEMLEESRLEDTLAGLDGISTGLFPPKGYGDPAYGETDEMERKHGGILTKEQCALMVQKQYSTATIQSILRCIQQYNDRDLLFILSIRE